MTYSLADIRFRLRRAKLSEVAEHSGVKAPTIASIRDGETVNPGVVTVASILAALDKIEGQPPMRKLGSNRIDSGGSAKKADAPTPRAARRRSKTSKAGVSQAPARGARRTGAGGPRSGGKRTGTRQSQPVVPVRKESKSAKRGRKAA